MFHFASKRGQRSAFADLPPTLQPWAVAASAPPSDHLRVVTLSGFIYFSFVAAGVAFSSLGPSASLAPNRPPDQGPTVVYERPPGFRVMLPLPGVVRGSGGAVEPTGPVPPATPTQTPTEASAGLSTEDHSRDRVGAGTGGPGAAPSPGSISTGPIAGSMVHDFTTVGLAVLRQVDPVYPEFARRAHIQGPVVLLMTVDEQGQPIQVQVLEGHPVFREAATQAARQWRFEPARVDGRPVAASFRLTLKFSLR